MIPLASVIMPVFDQEAYFAEAIESMRAQTFERWELLMVDDGSTDRSPAIAQAYALSDPDRIRLLRHPDRRRHGAAAARNLGLRQARGEFIAFLDADDAYEPDKLEVEVALLDSQPDAAMLYGPTLWWYPGTKRLVRPERLGVEPGRVYPPPDSQPNPSQARRRRSLHLRGPDPAHGCPRGRRLRAGIPALRGSDAVGQAVRLLSGPDRRKANGALSAARRLDLGGGCAQGRIPQLAATRGRSPLPGVV